ncbi:hypothetical protein HPNQ4053_0036 [Helicobacter pylori NQ4053]|uniref:Uncharacterized protein n=1 Tax=Helicobacter pylori NQ4053 TaxID=992027 RepID=J0JCH0_HELPX|nr:hypothetical protein HPNQ4053_0036 [Helicobacter pylori NQ4053]
MNLTLSLPCSYKNDRKTTKPHDYSKRLGFFSLSKKGF